ncbi:MAG: cytochrome P450 [Planctomycetaceae bacterium]|nr:cytochrome P450 [Planctomycetaceae bacterium]
MTTATTRLMPGPRGHWLRGCLRRFQQEPLEFYRECHREYGDYVRIRMVPGVDVYLLTHPDAVEHILQKHHKNFRKPDFFPKTVGLLAGNGILTSSGDFWLRQRRLMQPAFHRQQLERLVPAMTEAATAFVEERLKSPTETFDILPEMMKLSLRIAGNTLFSTDISADADEVGQAFRTTFDYVSYRMNYSPWTPVWWPNQRNREFALAKRVLDRVVLKIIANRRASHDKPDDLLTLLLAAQDEDSGGGMTDQQLLDEVLTLLTAGHETVGASLAWVWSLLGEDHDIQENVYDEIHSVLRGRTPTLEDLPNLPLTRAVYDETIRLYPPAWGQPRQSIDEDELGGYTLPKKSFIVISQWITQRHEAFWPDPHAFQPERFLTPDPQRPKFAYFPFGGGPRICIGNTFALMEAPLVMATILQRFRIRRTTTEPIVPDPTFTLRPKFGVPVRLEAR